MAAHAGKCRNRDHAGGSLLVTVPTATPTAVPVAPTVAGAPINVDRSRAGEASHRRQIDIDDSIHRDDSSSAAATSNVPTGCRPSRPVPRLMLAPRMARSAWRWRRSRQRAEYCRSNSALPSPEQLIARPALSCVEAADANGIAGLANRKRFSSVGLETSLPA